MTITVLGYIFHSKSVPATSTIAPTRVFVLQGSAVTKSVYGDRFYSTPGRRYLLSDMPKNIKIGQQLPKLQQMLYRHIFDSQFHVHDVLSARKCSNVTNAIPCLCTEIL